jgi:predicted HTH transcriptional regulator
MRQLDLFSPLMPAAEGNDTEFKSARGGLPGSFWETYSAMANTQGGTIVLGVAERNGELLWEGVPDAAQLRTVLWNQLNDRQKVSRNLLADADVRTVDDEGKKYVVVLVPRASRRDRPVYVGLNPLAGTYRRAEEGDYRCSEEEVRRMLADQADTPADAQIIEHFGPEDFDPETVKQYRNRFASRDPDHPWLSEDDSGLLGKLGALRRDRASGIEGATVAGLLMFGSFAALREALPAYHEDYRERLSNDPAVRWTDRLVPDGTWESNLFQFFQRVVQRLSADLKIPFQLDRALYRRDDTIVHEALREAVVNALIGERFTKLDATGVQAVVTARVEGAVTNGRMQEITGEHPKDITGVLQGLVRDGFLEQQNQRRWASYRLVGDSPQSSPQERGELPPDGRGLPPIRRRLPPDRRRDPATPPGTPATRRARAQPYAIARRCHAHCHRALVS